MSNCVCKCLSGVWGFIVGSLRVILFILCLFTFIGTIVSFYSVFAFKDHFAELDIDELSPSRLGLLKTLALAGLSLMGMHGAYSKDTTHLKWFALGIVVYATVNVVHTSISVTQTDWAAAKKNFSSKMRTAAGEYQFDLEPNEEPNKQTKNWDFLQRTFQCCGLEGPRDWTTKFKRSQIPNSCCSPGYSFNPSSPHSCSPTQSYRVGCETAMGAIFALGLASIFADCAMFFLLALIAIVVAKQFDCERSRSERSGNTDGPSQFTNPIAAPVQVSRQPAYYQQEYEKQPAQVYPNLSGFEGSGSPAPPNYVARA